jgi:glycosyltransferase involved in cell wall biosynthesis
VIIIVAAVGIGFPDGMAATARVTCYARGLRAAGHDVRILCLGPSETSLEAGSNTQATGLWNGIRYDYTSGSTLRSESFWRRRLARLAGLAGAARCILDESRAGQVEAVLLYSQQTADAAVMRWASRRTGATLLADVSEIPYQSASPGLLEQVRLAVYSRTFYRWLDGAVVISESLRRRVVRLGRPGVAVCTAPVMVDTDEWAAPGARPDPGVVLYSGTLDQQKDGVADLMYAFREVAGELPESRLVLVGDAPVGSKVEEFRDLAAKLGIADRVELTGRVPRSELPRLLAAASVLVLARPSSRQGEAGMPTKIAEYLASGVPTVLTRTGEIVGFVEDGTSAYLVPPGDSSALARTIRRVLLAREEAEVVGRRGREVAVAHFDYRVVTAKVSAFIAGIREEKSRRDAGGAAAGGPRGSA